MSAAYKAVCEKLLLKDSVKQNDLCCLCLKQVDESAISVNDKISVKFDPLKENLIEELMGRILVYTLGEQVTQSMALFESICKECAVNCINSFKFMKNSRQNIESLMEAAEDLYNCFENVAEDLHEYQSLFISVNPKEMTIQQFYDTRKQRNPSETALSRFHFIAYGSAATKKNSTRGPRDYSTIFIKTHELVVDPSKPKEYKCKICFKVFPSSGNLRHHFFSNHFKKEFQCTECPKSFGTAGLLKTHTTISHSTVNCDECGKVLLNRTSSIKRHKLIHTQAAKVCPKCNRHYKKRTDFDRHVARNSCEVPSKLPGDFICDICNYHTHFKHQLSNHMKFQHFGAKGYVCEWCNRQCYTQSALKTHILKHTKEKNYICSDCGGKFGTKQSLLQHMRLHTGERPYPCSLCDQSFLSASRRTDHIVRYHANVSFDCDLCDAKYNAKRSLLKHRRRHFENV